MADDACGSAVATTPAAAKKSLNIVLAWKNWNIWSPLQTSVLLVTTTRRRQKLVRIAAEVAKGLFVLLPLEGPLLPILTEDPITQAE